MPWNLTRYYGNGRVALDKSEGSLTTCVILPAETSAIRLMKMRKLAERLSRGVVLRRRLPSRFQSLPIYVTPEAGLRYWLSMSRVDPTLQGMAEELVHPGSIVWDVGANVGLFSFCAAALAGESGSVLSIEPDLYRRN